MIKCLGFEAIQIKLQQSRFKPLKVHKFEDSLYCKRGRENTGVSLYKQDSTVDKLIQTDHLIHLRGHRSPKEKKQTNQKRETNTQILWIFLYCPFTH